MKSKQSTIYTNCVLHDPEMIQFVGGHATMSITYEGSTTTE